MAEWRTVERPGFFGKKKGEFFRQYDDDYGFNSWRIMWQWNEGIIPAKFAYQIYEDAYFYDSLRREDLWLELTEKAKDVYDKAESDIESELDYGIQKSNSTHLQDIAIRRVVLRRGSKFKGNELIQVRSHNEYWGQNLSPGKVQFHIPSLIVAPHLEGWWDYDSIEGFYQSNKILQVKE